jgi:alkylhydroperoxidase family enzyme
MSRIPPLPPGEWSPEMREALAALRPAHPRHPLPPRRDDRPKALNALGTLARHPELTKAFNTFNGYILFSSTLSPRQRELVVLRVASLRASDYEWRQHAILAADAGLEEDEVRRIALGPEAPGWSPVDAAMLRSVDELIGEGAVSTPTWESLAGELDEQQLMDLVFTVGAYEILAMAFRSFGVELDDDLKRK